MYRGKILDPIHGLIKLSEIEKWVISQKPFNRLRRIKQNTFLYLIFPSSNHTRFEHSLGVMHLAHQIYNYANENYETGSYKKKKYNQHDTTLDFDFYSVQKGLLENENLLIQELRIAALLHDVGHGPMSHTFDYFTLTGNELLKIVHSDPLLSLFESNFQAVISGKKEEKIKHEIISCIFIIKIIHDLKEISKTVERKFDTEEKKIIKDMDVERIIKMVEPDFNPKFAISFNGIDYTSFFTSIISNFPLDADRMDYLYRDSYFSGVKYGFYDLSRLLMSFIPIVKDNKVSLAIKESGIDSVIRFIQSRTHLFNQVYLHKTNRSANCMIDFACRKIANVIEANNYLELENFYWTNSDELFLAQTLKNKINTEKELQVLDELFNRKLWKRVYQKKIVTTPDEKINVEKKFIDIKTKIDDALKQLEDLNIDVAVDNLPNKVFKDYKKSEIKIIRKADPKYKLESDWKTFNKELKILEYEVHFFRIYLRRTFTSPGEFVILKKQVLDSFNEIINVVDGIA